MKITDIHITGFGVWNEMFVDDLSSEITLFYGPNEAGKTTLMQFVRALLYGFSAERRRLYLPPVYGGVSGGMLRVVNHSGDFVLERQLDDDDDHMLGRPVVMAGNGSRQGQHLLNVLLSGIDEPIFNNVFAVGIRELQELATLNDTQAAEQLYNLASGVDRVSLVEVMRHLEKERSAIWGPQEETVLGGLVTERDRLRAEIDALGRQTRRWSDLSSQQRTLIQEVGELDERISHLEKEARVVEIAIQVRDKWNARREVSTELDEIGPLEDLPEGCLEQLGELNEAIDQERQHLTPLKNRRRELRQKLSAQPINRSLWDNSCRIEAVCEHGPWIASLDDEIGRLKQNVEESEVELLKHDERLAVEGGVKLADSPVVSSRVLQQLQAPAQTLIEALKKRSIARKLQKKSHQQVDEATDELQVELDGRPVENFEEALEQAATNVKLLRRRIDIEEHLEQMWRQRKDLEAEHQEMLDDQLQRVRILFGIGAMFVFGSVLLLSGMFGWKVMPMSAEVGWGVSFLGLVCVGLSIAWKVVLERTAQEELDTCIRRQDSLENEIESLIEEREEIDEQLPHGGGTLTTRLHNTERQLRELESMAPLHMERQQAQRRKHDARRHSSGVTEDLREARSRWRRALRNAGLPESLTPKHVRQLAAHHQRKSKVDERLNEQRERLSKLQRDREALTVRLEGLNQELGMNAVGENPQLQLSQLETALSGQREMMQQRRELQREEKELRREMSRHLQTLRRLSRKRESLFADARVSDEEELRERANLLEHVASLDDRHQSLCDQIFAILGGHCTEAEIEAELTQHGKKELEQRWSVLIARLQDSQTHLGQMHQRRGEVSQEMKSLSENTRLPTARFQLACVEEKIERAAESWRQLAVTSCLLEDIREAYEAERQPETLSEASMYLEKLTDGKYIRIWTPLGKNELRIDDSEGRPVSLDVLSRGTREAVFLALRLALVAAYGRRGVSIPMILDDVLVSLDAGRAQSAVHVLSDFAKDGRQLLFFTCHEHIQQMFMDAAVDVRILPSERIPGTRVESLVYGQEEAIIEHQEEEVEEIAFEEEEAEEETVFGEEEIAVEEEEEVVAEEPTEADDEEYSLEEAIDLPVMHLDLTDFLNDDEPEEEPIIVVAAEEEEEEEEVVVEEEPVPVTAEEPEVSDDIDYVFTEVNMGGEVDEDGVWWWEFRQWPTEEETAA